MVTKMAWANIAGYYRKKKAEAANLMNERQPDLIYNTVTDIITVFANKKLCYIFEYSLDEILGKQLIDFMDEERKESAKMIIWGMVRGITENFDFDFLTKTGNRIWANLSVTPILNDGGKFEGMLAMVTDITRRKETNSC